MNTLKLRHLLITAGLSLGLLSPLHAQVEDGLRGEHALGIVGAGVTEALTISLSPLYVTGRPLVDPETGFEYEDKALDYGAVTQIEASADGVQQARFAGSITFQRSAIAYVHYSDLFLDASQGVVYADASLPVSAEFLDSSLLPYVQVDAQSGLTTLQDMPLWQIAYASEDGRSFALRLAPEGLEALSAGLRLSAPAKATLGNTDLGQLHFTTTPVPEASTLMLMGLGLAGIAVVQRRRPAVAV